MICVPPSKTSSSKPSAHGYFTTDDATTSRPRSTCTPKPSATGSANSATFTETGSKTPQPCCNSQSHSAPAAGPKCWPLPLASTRRGPGQEGQTELADLDLITIDQHRRIHRLPVDIGAVEAADIDDAELALLPLELGVAAADGNVVEEDAAVGMAAARGCDGLVQQKSGTRVGAACDDEQR